MKNIVFNSHRILRNQEGIKYLVIIFFLFSTTYFFTRIFFGLDFSDSFFHLNQASEQFTSNNAYTFFLSSFFIGELINIAGEDIVILRFINALFIYASVIIPYIFLPKRSYTSKYFFIASCVLILLTALNPNILGFDTFSVFFASMIFITTVSLLKNHSFFSLLALIILCVLNVFVRLPNIYLIPVIAIIFHANGFKGKNLPEFAGFRRTLTFLLPTVFLIVLGYFIYFHKVAEFSETIFRDKHHSPKILILNYFNDFLILTSYVFSCLIFYLSVKKIFQIERGLKKIIGFLILGSISSSLIISFVLLSKYSRNYSLLLCAIAISFVIVGFIKAKKKNQKSILSLFIFFLFMIPFGSNTGLLKSSLLIVLLPFALMFSELEKVKVLMLLFLLPFSIFEGLFSIYEDKNVFALESKPEIEVLSSIRTSNTRSDYIENIADKVVDLRQQGFLVYFYGDKSHIFTFLYPKTSLASGAFFQPLDDPKILWKVKSELENDNKMAIFIVDSYPDQNKNIEDTKLVRGLKELNFEKVKNNLVYYVHR